MWGRDVGSTFGGVELHPYRLLPEHDDELRELAAKLLGLDVLLGVGARVVVLVERGEGLHDRAVHELGLWMARCGVAGEARGAMYVGQDEGVFACWSISSLSSSSSAKLHFRSCRSSTNSRALAEH